jgi:hypothetical protein
VRSAVDGAGAYCAGGRLAGGEVGVRGVLLRYRTGGFVLPFDASASDGLRDLLSAIAVYALGGERLLRERRHHLPGAVSLLEHLGKRG